MSNWVLFVDETGNFSDPNEQVAVAGVLTRSIDQPALRDRLQKRLSEVVPRVPWPLHASTLRVAASRAAFDVYLAERGDTSFPEVTHACAPAVRALERAASGSDEAALFEHARAEGARWTPPDAISTERIRRADGKLQRDPSVYGGLRRLREEQESALLAFCRAEAGACYGASGLWGAVAYSGPNLVLVGAGDRYLALLDALVLRVREALDVSAGTGRNHVLWLYVAARDLENDGAGNRVAMTAAALGAVRERVTRAASAAGASATVDIVARTPLPYRARVHPGLVLADWLANRARAVLRAERSGAEISTALRDRTGFSCVFDETLEGRPALPLFLSMSESPERWALEQRDCWGASSRAVGRSR